MRQFWLFLLLETYMLMQICSIFANLSFLTHPWFYSCFHAICQKTLFLGYLCSQNALKSIFIGFFKLFSVCGVSKTERFYAITYKKSRLTNCPPIRGLKTRFSCRQTRFLYAFWCFQWVMERNIANSDHSIHQNSLKNPMKLLLSAFWLHK